jgi:hypothetical protein
VPEGKQRWLKPGTKEWDREFKFDRVATAVLRMGDALDDLTAVVTSGAMVEFLLRELIAAKAKLDILEPPNQSMAFMSMVRLARALEVLPDELVQPVQKLAHVRNGFAHRISHVLSEEDVKKVRDSLSEPQRRSVDAFEEEVLMSRELPRGPALSVRCFAIWLLDELHEAVATATEKAKA